jgi:hypothetical protein
MNRKELQTISKLRVKEVRILLQKNCFSGAYYLLGYAVECALKSCIAKQIKRFDFPDRKLINDSYTHNLEKLLNVSGSKERLVDEIEKNPDLAVNWAIVNDWSEQSRYSIGISATTAQDLFFAVTDKRNGVLSWLKKYW